ncbi:MAG: restriction endonuclease [Bacilli bacterium]|nr:restriction endonuclease [Bacilli bacterium]
MFDLKEELTKGEYLFPNTIEEIDEFTGSEFENYLFFFFKSQGYKVRKTNDSSDKGIDIIVTYPENGNETIIGIQAKRWKQNVGSQEIRNMLDGKEEYSCDYLWLVTTSGVTRDAGTTALNTGITIKQREFVINTLRSLKELPNVKFRHQTSKETTAKEKIDADLSNNEKELYDRLRILRLSISKEKNTQLWMVFSNETILDIIKKSPKKVEDLKNIKGLGQKKIDDFGSRILEIIK